MSSTQNVSVLFRKSYCFNDEDINKEFVISSNNFNTIEYRSLVKENSIVIGRYSVLPYYKELENELTYKNSRLINSYNQHNYIADITNYYQDVKGYTPNTYTEWGSLPEGKYVVKGRTNSRKFEWNTKMFANSKSELLHIIKNVYGDSFLSDQGIVVRDYIPLKTFDISMNGLPITDEFRFFFYKSNLLCSGYYWSNFEEFNHSVEDGMIKFAKKIANIIKDKANFFVLDIGKTENNDYILIEVNDGQMSGLSMCDPAKLYENLKKYIIDNV